jgi:hypothetical protein
MTNGGTSWWFRKPSALTGLIQGKQAVSGFRLLASNSRSFLSVATGTVMRRTSAATGIGRTTGADKTFRSLEGKFRHFFLKMLLVAFRTTNRITGPKDDGLEILPTIQTGIFKNRHAINLLCFSAR